MTGRRRGQVRVAVANSDLALARGDVEAALGMMRAVPKDSPHFLKAKMAMADIYLKSRNDKVRRARRLFSREAN